MVGIIKKVGKALKAAKKAVDDFLTEYKQIL